MYSKVVKLHHVSALVGFAFRRALPTRIKAEGSRMLNSILGLSLSGGERFAAAVTTQRFADGPRLRLGLGYAPRFDEREQIAHGVVDPCDLS